MGGRDRKGYPVSTSIGSTGSWSGYSLVLKGHILNSRSRHVSVANLASVYDASLYSQGPLPPGCCLQGVFTSRGCYNQFVRG